jgi:hypothetical protein
MRGFAAGLLLVIVAALGAWIFAFGPVQPCVALTAEAGKLTTGEKKDPVGTAIITAVAAGKVTMPECAATAVRLRAMGKQGVTAIVKP